MSNNVFLAKEFSTGGYLGGPYESSLAAQRNVEAVLAGGYQIVPVPLDGIDFSGAAADVLDEVWERVATALPAIREDADLLQDISTEIISERLT